MFTKIKNKISNCTSKSGQFKLIGITGLIVIMFWNVVAPLIYQNQQAHYFQLEWWSVWFPNYVVWLSLLAVGYMIKDKNSTDTSDFVEVNSISS